MNIKFMGLTYDISNDLEKNNLYIFSNPNDKNEILNRIKDPFAKYKLISENEFWERYLLSENIVLKEEKEVVFFYNSLTKEQKKKLQIENYFDCIDIAYRYYSFMKEYVDYKLDINNINVYKWQEIRLKDILEIHRQMIEKVIKEKRMPRYMIPIFSYTNNKFIEKFNKIVFVDKFSFTKFEKDILCKISNIEISLSVEENDYDLEKLELKNITLPSIINSEKIKIVECNDKFAQNISLIDNSEKFKVFYDSDESYKNKLKSENILLNQEEILTCNNFALSNVANYRLIKGILECIKNKTKLGYQISDVYRLYSMKDFINLFEVDESIIITLMKKHKNNEKYIGSDKVNLELLDRFSNAKEFADIEQDIYKILDYVSEKDYDLEITYPLYEAITEINTQDFSFLDNFSIDYLTLLLKYFDAKSFNIKIENSNVIVKSINNLSSLKKEKLGLINMQGSFKFKIPNLFSNRQRLEIGLPTKENMIFEILHLYYKSIINSDEVYISYVKNEEENIEEFAFITNLIYTYKVKVEKFKISISERAKLLNDILFKNEIEEDEKKSSTYLTEEDTLKFDPNFNLEKISVSNFLKLMNSECEFYLSKKINVNYIYDDDIKNYEIGNFIHSLMEKIMLYIKVNNNKLSISKEKISEFLAETKEEYKKFFLEKYFKFIEYRYLIGLEDKIFSFILNLKKELIHEKIEDILIEKELTYKVELSNGKKITINGKADLIIITEKITYIIDFKTGEYSAKKKESYADQLNFYSFMDELKNNEEKKMILSFILTNRNFEVIDYNDSKINEKYIVEILEKFINDKEIYEKGKIPDYSDYKGVIK